VELNKVYNEDALTGLSKLTDKSVNMCITSPPYWMQRDYKTDNQLGLEPTIDMYVSNLCDVFDEVKRVLRDDGTMWLNIGDKYQDKSLLMLPQRVALEMCKRGWLLRNAIVWQKPNAMPTPAKDRFTIAYEMVYFFTKSKSYYFNQQFEPFTSNFDTWGWNRHEAADVDDGYAMRPKSGSFEGPNTKGRNMRDVWSISTGTFRGAHCAVFPEKLIQTPIDAGCPTRVCTKCGKPVTPLYERKSLERYELPKDDPRYRPARYSGKYDGGMRYADVKLVGEQTCDCDAEFKKGLVLDPFMGAGTSALASKNMNRDYIGFEINPEYIKLGEQRLNEN